MRHRLLACFILAISQATPVAAADGEINTIFRCGAIFTSLMNAAESMKDPLLENAAKERLSWIKNFVSDPKNTVVRDKLKSKWESQGDNFGDPAVRVSLRNAVLQQDKESYQGVINQVSQCDRTLNVTASQLPPMPAAPPATSARVNGRVITLPIGWTETLANSSQILRSGPVSVGLTSFPRTARTLREEFELSRINSAALDLQLGSKPEKILRPVVHASHKEWEFSEVTKEDRYSKGSRTTQLMFANSPDRYQYISSSIRKDASADEVRELCGVVVKILWANGFFDIGHAVKKNILSQCTKNLVPN